MAFIQRFALILLLLAACQRSQSVAQEHASQSLTAIASSNSVTNAPSIVFLGDSLTAGLGLEENEALPALIQQRVQQSGRTKQVINAGRSGDTSAGGLSRLAWYLRDEVNLSVLVVGLGSNDAMRGLPLAPLEANLRAIIQRTRAKRPDVVILLWQLHTFPNLGEAYASDYAAIFPRVASEEHVELVPFPLSQIAGVAELNQADGIHPTREGMRRVADQVWKVLEPRL